MPHSEHTQTRTYGGRGAITARNEKGLHFRDALARDIRDVKKISGAKYNSGIRGMISYYKEKHPGLIKKENSKTC